MSGGRVIFGAAIGYRPEEFAAFQTPLEGRGAQFVEMVKLMKRLWSEEKVTHESERYGLDSFTMEPRPIQQPHPPVWLGGWGKLAVQRAARLGDSWIPGPTANLTKLKEAQGRYNTHLADMGIDPRQRERPLTRDVVIAETQEKAEEMAQKYLLAAYRDEYSSWEHPLIGSSDQTATDKMDELRHERFIIGSPDSVIEQVRFFEREFGMNHLICRLHFPGMPPEMVTREIELLGREVVPVLASAK